MSISQSVKGLSAEVIRALTTRIELFGLEWQQAKEDLPRLLALWVVGLLCILFALALLTLLLIVIAWDTPYRNWVVLGLCAAFAIAGAVLLLRVRSLCKGGRLNPFSATIEELQRDAQALLAKQQDSADSEGVATSKPRRSHE